MQQNVRGLRVGIAGLGTVGGGLIEIVRGPKNYSVFDDARGHIAIVAVSARDRARKRAVNLDGLEWFDDARALAVSPNIDVFVELIGGADGIALEAVQAALDHGKSVVTANKALLAKHGPALSARAEKNNAILRFEAAVAGAVPIIASLRQSLSVMCVTRLTGILNGTCNYILSEMESAGLDYRTALKNAQEQGFAEADPALDVEGVDAAQKLAILSAIVFGKFPDERDIAVTGIDGLHAVDLEAARSIGRRVRLVATASRDGDRVGLEVAPVFALPESNIGAVMGPDNFISISGEPVGDVWLGGPGAGAGATAGAVAGDILAIARGEMGPVFGREPGNILRGGTDNVLGMRSRFVIRAKASHDAMISMIEGHKITGRAIALSGPNSEFAVIESDPIDGAAITALKQGLDSSVMKDSFAVFRLIDK